MLDRRRQEDTALAALACEPFRIVRPAIQTAPFVFASPHSGRTYPRSFLAESWLTPLALRRSEDAYVDELLEGSEGLGAPRIVALFPRVFVDVNRAASELDAAMFDAPLAVEVGLPTQRVSGGLGVIPKVVRDGAEIYRDRLPAHDAEERLRLFYRPYHDALALLVKETVRRFGVAVVIDCHSMPSGPSTADLVLGDRYGMSAGPDLMRHAERAFEAGGFSTARNMPYAGGHTTFLYGRRAEGIHALQVEINRGLYLDEDAVRHGPLFEAVRCRLHEALHRLLAIDHAQLGAQRPLAAE
ncbi:MAG: N-formylglutamate amidohydrolase [Alphaproteobacteria bacterium]|nr:N-formylglutamate amidohydrolase [Alphaproteobacteria bacterium]